MRVVRYTLDEAVEKLDPQNAPARSDLSSISNEASEDWDLGLGYPKAWKFVRMGWIEKAGELSRYTAGINDILEDHVDSFWDVTGESVDVGRFLSGEPECMLNFNHREDKLITFEVNISARCSVDAHHLFNRGIAVAAGVAALQARGYGVRLAVYDAVDTSNGGIASHKTVIEINRFGDYIDPGRIAFFIAHPGALRRLMFRLQEHESDAVRREYGFHSGGGYGYPANPREPDPTFEGECIVNIPWVEGDRLRTPVAAFGVVEEQLKKHNISLRRPEF